MNFYSIFKTNKFTWSKLNHSQFRKWHLLRSMSSWWESVVRCRSDRRRESSNRRKMMSSSKMLRHQPKRRWTIIKILKTIWVAFLISSQICSSRKKIQLRELELSNNWNRYKSRYWENQEEWEKHLILSSKTEQRLIFSQLVPHQESVIVALKAKHT